jgi:EAL domain-containing protein (putative c-di-GMP-specific phosphodiesterase class I)
MLLLGSWIMKAAFSRYVTLRRERRIDDDVYLTLNISFVQFTSQLFLEEIKDAIDSTGMPGSRVELEITEYTCSHIPEISVERLKELKRMGISVVLDDFGIGYASLSFLRTLPFTAVKIDKSLIDTIDASSNSNLVKPVIELAHSIGLNVVAEGVENEMQYNCLLDWKCDFMQGFYLSKPVP